MAKTVEYRYNRQGLVFITKATKVEKDWYEWSIELESAPVGLNKVKEVEYILHPTFRDRIRTVRSAERKFKLESEGWGEFDIAVNVYYRTGEEQIALVPLKLA